MDLQSQDTNTAPQRLRLSDDVALRLTFAGNASTPQWVIDTGADGIELLRFVEGTRHTHGALRWASLRMVRAWDAFRGLPTESISSDAPPVRLARDAAGTITRQRAQIESLCQLLLEGAEPAGDEDAKPAGSPSWSERAQRLVSQVQADDQPWLLTNMRTALESGLCEAEALQARTGDAGMEKWAEKVRALLGLPKRQAAQC